MKDHKCIQRHSAYIIRHYARAILFHLWTMPWFLVEQGHHQVRLGMRGHIPSGSTVVYGNVSAAAGASLANSLKLCCHGQKVQWESGRLIQLTTVWASLSQTVANNASIAIFIDLSSDGE